MATLDQELKKARERDERAKARARTAAKRRRELEAKKARAERDALSDFLLPYVEQGRETFVAAAGSYFDKKYGSAGTQSPHVDSSALAGESPDHPGSTGWSNAETSQVVGGDRS